MFGSSVLCIKCVYNYPRPILEMNDMNRPIAGVEKKSFRLNMLLEPLEVEALDNFRYSARIPSRAAAIRLLIKIGLETAQGKSSRETEL